MLDFAAGLARRAGALLLDGLARDRAVALKSAFEVVTDVDRASEALIVAAIAERFPHHTIVAEEGGGIERGSPERWVIDPLDGTNNYAHGFPFFSVSIGLLRGEELALGVVYDPLRDELFAAERGRGAFCNGRTIRVSATPTLAASLLSTGFPYDYAAGGANNWREFDRMQARSQGVRRAGAASLDLAYVAMGRLDAHWELRLQPWDSAAGALLVLEAGGRLSDWRGGPWNPWSDRLIASNGRIHDEIIHVLSAEGMGRSGRA
ncbi:MAG TPA: inositol monophosphatase family protein [Roseiflexaceae bacterium]|nr:inositol monophosphatase family protein [Roseiflexaceae bacterium]